MKIALVALALGGCDLLFDIHRLEVASASDAQSSDGDAKAFLDAQTDAADCGGHDEDGDGVFDKCDRCPTISDANDGDGDNDGVGNVCDPDQGVANTIDAFYSFQTGAGFSAGATFPNDTMQLANVVVSTKSFTTPERIVLSIAGLPAPPADVQLTLNPGSSSQVDCELATTCTASAPTCLFAYRGTTQAATMNLTLAPAQVASLALARGADNIVTCSVNGTALVVPGAVMPSGKLQLSAPDAAVNLPNLIVYNGP